MKVLLFALAIVGLSTAAQSQTSPFDNYLRIVNKKLTILQDIGCITVMECKLFREIYLKFYYYQKLIHSV